MKEVLLIVVAYMIGSIPTSVWVSRFFFGIDIREYGSGNAGATNSFRVMGPRLGTLVMIVDMLKGFAAVKLAYFLPFYVDDEFYRTGLQIGLGLAAVLGHIFPLWANFRGGKGVATLFGLVLGISPWTALGCVGIFLFVLYLTRFVSLSSILASIAFPIFILVIFNVDNPAYRVFAIAVALLVVHPSKEYQSLITRKREQSAHFKISGSPKGPSSQYKIDSTVFPSLNIH